MYLVTAPLRDGAWVWHDGERALFGHTLYMNHRTKWPRVPCEATRRNGGGGQAWIAPTRVLSRETRVLVLKSHTAYSGELPIWARRRQRGRGYPFC